MIRLRSNTGTLHDEENALSSVGGMRRSRLSIIADILSHAQEPARKTHIMYGCHLSFSQLKHYLNYLSKIALIRSTTKTGSIIYQTTNDGEEFLKQYSSITQLLRSPAIITS